MLICVENLESLDLRFLPENGETLPSRKPVRVSVSDDYMLCCMAR